MSEEKQEVLGLKLVFIKVMQMLHKNLNGYYKSCKSASKALDKAGMTISDVDFSNLTKLCCSRTCKL
jgi:hypothetical protein